MGANSNAWDSRLAQRHTSTCKRTKSTESSISAHELSLVIQAFGNLNSVALGTFMHDSPPTIKASRVLSEDHSFCKRLKPRTQAPLFCKRFDSYASGSSWQNRLSAFTRRFMPDGCKLQCMGLAFGPKAYVHVQENQIHWIEHFCSRIVAGDISSRVSCAWFAFDKGLQLSCAGFFPSKRPQVPVGNLRPYRAHELFDACFTAGWRRPCREPRSRRGGTAGWRRGREGSRGR